MAKRKTTTEEIAASDYVLGRDRFSKISAVEGIHLSDAMKKRIADFDRKGLSAAARRDAIIRNYSQD